METKELKYTVINNKSQYFRYCDLLENLLDNSGDEDEIELLTVLIEAWDRKNSTLIDLTPIELLKGLMKENNLRQKDLVEILDLSKGTISKILNCKKSLSKESIRKLSKFFKLNQEAFNRPYEIYK